MRGGELSMQHVEALFMETLKELEARVSAQDPYMILGASALIRKLLLDDFPLVDQVNRQYRLKFTFEVTESPNFPTGLPEPMFYSVQDAIDPETVRPGKARKTVNRDQLLSYVLAKVNGRPYTLREIVLFEANVMGGVHAGSPKEDKERLLHEINNMVAIGGYRSSLRQLQAIGRVIIKGLTPLRNAIEQANSV
jgi:hypothetical protein